MTEPIYHHPKKYMFLESKEFADRFSDFISDHITSEQARIIGYYLYYGRAEEAGRFLSDLMTDRVRAIVDEMSDNYQPCPGDFE